MRDAKILLGVCGGIAAYKSASLTSTLVQQGAIVDVIMTQDAQRFISPLSFSALTARPVFTSLWDAPERIPHIRLVREAQVMVIAPATANTLAKLANGVADDLLTTAVLAARVPVLIAPAMNTAMYENAATQENLRLLRSRGYEFVEPEAGYLAEGERGIGRLASEEHILAAIGNVLQRTQSLRDLRVAITAGPTREAFDPVRYISNPSSGAMGIALAREARARGAQVMLILGPTLLPEPPEVDIVRVTTAQEMYEAALRHAVDTDITIAAAAVSDWRPEQRAQHKAKKSDERLDTALVRTPDILQTLGERKGETFLVGFAAETCNFEEYGREKLRTKNLDAIAVNDVSDEQGFGPGNNTLTLLWGERGNLELGSASKPVLAARLFDAIERLRKERNVARD